MNGDEDIEGGWGAIGYNIGELEITRYYASLQRMLDCHSKQRSMQGTKIKYAVAMSGGVDSSTAAAILLNDGYHVVGVTMDIHEHSASAVDGARKICELLRIEHFVLDARFEFKQRVMDVFASYYARGLTPNPCALCNRDIKMSLLFDYAKSLGASKLATGHYAHMSINDGVVRLREAANPKRDQSYFLALVPRQNLKDILFPLSNMRDKDETRRLAKSFGLPNFKQEDSQDICFIPDGNYKSFLRAHYSDLNMFVSGDMKLFQSGKTIGRHCGVANYTVGQRRGLGVSHSSPLYVKEVNPSENEITLCQANELSTLCFEVLDVNWILEMPDSFEAFIKQRSACPKTPALITKITETRISVELLKRPSSPITGGQICVMYDSENIVIGGGIISELK
ncbi:MAG: tRNA 2-thiouridine(34) synthase MnmA [Holosporales bacterium]|jgi:tRNA-specific 2-thiouridylase|nr:tRNA 2-thiouridine(34) synthase MnmA [Holosporales bacterium]